MTKAFTYFNKPWGLFLVLMVLYWNTIHCQINLIQNGDFETLSLIQFSSTSINGQAVELNRRDTSMFWWSGNTKKHYHVVSKHWNFSPDSSVLNDNAYYNARYSKTGNSHQGYVYGMIQPLMADSKNSYRVKNIVGILCKPLKKGNTYEVSFWVRPFTGNYYIDNIGVHFTNQIKPYHGRVKYKHPKEKNKSENHAWIVQNIFQPEKLNYDCHIEQRLDNIEEYVELKCQYTAKGGETYIHIGNLQYEYPEKIKKKNLNPYGSAERRYSKYTVPACEYLIDDVSLISLSDTLEGCGIYADAFVNTAEYPSAETEIPITRIEENTIEIPESSPVLSTKKEMIILDNYYFETDSFILKSVEQEQLLGKIRSLDFNQIKHIEIIGHTDDQGNSAYNENLSLKRAKSIQVVIHQTNTAIMIYTAGKGSRDPVVSNDSIENRRRNRRVEIIIHYK